MLLPTVQARRADRRGGVLEQGPRAAPAGQTEKREWRRLGERGRATDARRQDLAGNHAIGGRQRRAPRRARGQMREDEDLLEHIREGRLLERQFIENLGGRVVERNDEEPPENVEGGTWAGDLDEHEERETQHHGGNVTPALTISAEYWPPTPRSGPAHRWAGSIPSAPRVDKGLDATCGGP